MTATPTGGGETPAPRRFSPTRLVWQIGQLAIAGFVLSVILGVIIQYFIPGFSWSTITGTVATATGPTILTVVLSIIGIATTILVVWFGIGGAKAEAPAAASFAGNFWVHVTFLAVIVLVFFLLAYGNEAFTELGYFFALLGAGAPDLRGLANGTVASPPTEVVKLLIWICAVWAFVGFISAPSKKG